MRYLLPPSARGEASFLGEPLLSREGLRSAGAGEGLRPPLALGDRLRESLLGEADLERDLLSEGERDLDLLCLLLAGERERDLDRDLDLLYLLLGERERDLERDLLIQKRFH